MNDFFEKKQIKDFSAKIQKVFNLLTISRKINIVGSASFKNIRYINDYDLNEIYQRNFDTDEALDEIYKMFKEKFRVAEKDKNIFITDLKCGKDCDDEPLRWNKHDIKKGTKIMNDGRVITFQECILMKTTFKMDVVKNIDGVFTEFSDNYLIKLGIESNFFPHDISINHLKNALKHSYDDYFYTCRNLFKGLKRAFSYFLTSPGKNEDILKKMLAFFNSPVGKMYQLKSQLDTLILMLENESGFRSPKIADIHHNIKLILSELEPLPTTNIKSNLQKAINSKTKKQLIKLLTKSKEDLFIIVNQITADFVLKNKEAAIY